jgi:hypothetical protein
VPLLYRRRRMRCAAQLLIATWRRLAGRRGRQPLLRQAYSTKKQREISNAIALFGLGDARRHLL